ncbi:endonuclease domain-containing protein [Streptomyces sp. NPDC059680]|uniref:endonuclease domain-containing protein n=1 Tax=Streptomyces sp. NPDC059680 TaxID=3346904 RepID=UPI00368626BD
MQASGFGICYECERRLSIDRFRTSGNGLSGICAECQNNRTRLKRFKLSASEYENLLHSQGNTCAICRRPDPGGKYGEWHVDHDHNCCPSGTTCGNCVRGILCSECNIRGIAWYEALPADLQTFELLNNYLKNPPAATLPSSGIRRGSKPTA